jgi:hypothetical protein
MNTKLLSIILMGVIALSACGTLEVTLEQPPTPTVDAARVATIVAATLAAWPAATRSASAGPQTYVDPELGFRLRYDASWQFDARPGSGMIYSAGRGRTLTLKNEDYVLQLNIIAGPGDVNGCSGMFQGNPAGQYVILHVDGVDLWRIRAESGEINGFSNENSSYLDIIAPLALYKQPDASGFWGSYTCEPQINNVGVQICYRFPVSLDELKAGHFRQDLLAEMDQILASLTWK